MYGAVYTSTCRYVLVCTCVLWTNVFPGIVKSVDKDILTKSTLDGLKALKLVNCVMEDSPDLTKVANLLHCFSYSSSPHVEEFCSLCKEAKIQV